MDEAEETKVHEAGRQTDVEHLQADSTGGAPPQSQDQRRGFRSYTSIRNVPYPRHESISPLTMPDPFPPSSLQAPMPIIHISPRDLLYSSSFGSSSVCSSAANSPTYDPSYCDDCKVSSPTFPRSLDRSGSHAGDSLYTPTSPRIVLSHILDAEAYAGYASPLLTTPHRLPTPTPAPSSPPPASSSDIHPAIRLERVAEANTLVFYSPASQEKGDHMDVDMYSDRDHVCPGSSHASARLRRQTPNEYHCAEYGYPGKYEEGYESVWGDFGWV